MGAGSVAAGGSLRGVARRRARAGGAAGGSLRGVARRRARAGGAAGGSLRGVLLALVLAALLGGAGAGEAGAHAGLVRSDPAAGAALGASPASVRLTLSERAEPSLSVVRVLDAGGAAQQNGPPAAVPGDPSSLQVPLRTLRRGVYTVTWRSLSAVDGHATSGSFAFGVGATPTGAAARATSTSPGGSAAEMLARFLLIAGLVALLGGAVGGIARFAGAGGVDVRLAACGWLLAAAGLALLFDAQRRSAGGSVGELLDSDVGAALVRRAAALGVAGLALVASWRWRAGSSSRRWRAGASSRRAPGPGRSRHREDGALAAAALAAVVAMGAHVAAGHAGAGGWPRAISVGAQWAHFAAAGIWIGGLAALLLGLRGSAPSERARATRRFAIVAAIGIGVVAVAGTLRAVDELAAWSDLWSGAYGRAIVAKVALLALIAALAARSRRAARLGPEGAATAGTPAAAEERPARSAARTRAAVEERPARSAARTRAPVREGAARGPRAAGDARGLRRTSRGEARLARGLRRAARGEQRPARGLRRAARGEERPARGLRRAARGELVLAAVAIALAGVLGSIAPPVAGESAPPGLSATGADFATTTRVKLTAASTEPGANSFVARVTDYDSGEPIRGARVSLRFEPLDDPGEDATSLKLAPAANGAYAGAGANLAFDGRWRVTALVQSRGDAVEVPLELDVPSPEHFVSVQRVPGLAPQYTAQLVGTGYVRIVVDPERAGPNRVTASVFTVFEDVADVEGLVLTAAAGESRAQQRPVRRLRARGTYSASVDLAPGKNTIAVVAHDRGGARQRAVFELDVPR